MKEFENLLTQIESKIPLCESSNEAISKSNIGWHIEHILLTLNGITSALEKSDPKDYQWKFNFVRIIVLTMKKIPRGKAKAPKVVLPKTIINKDTLISHLAKTRENIKMLDTIDKNKFFEHPYFGKLKTKQAISVLEIHTKHHLMIIEDILK